MAQHCAFRPSRGTRRIKDGGNIIGGAGNGCGHGLGKIGQSGEGAAPIRAQSFHMRHACFFRGYGQYIPLGWITDQKLGFRIADEIADFGCRIGCVEGIENHTSLHSAQSERHGLH